MSSQRQRVFSEPYGFWSPICDSDNTYMLREGSCLVYLLVQKHSDTLCSSIAHLSELFRTGKPHVLKFFITWNSGYSLYKTACYIHWWPWAFPKHFFIVFCKMGGFRKTLWDDPKAWLSIPLFMHLLTEHNYRSPTMCQTLLWTLRLQRWAISPPFWVGVEHALKKFPWMCAKRSMGPTPSQIGPLCPEVEMRAKPLGEL